MKERLGVFRHMNPSINPRVHCAIASYSVCAEIPGFIRTEHISGHKASIFNWRRSLLSPPSRSRRLCAAHHSISSRSPPVASDTARRVILSSRLALIRSLPLPCVLEDSSPSVSGAFLCFLALTLPVLLLPIRHEQHQHPGSALLASPPSRDSH